MASNTGCMSAGAGNWSGRSNSASVDWMRKPRPSPQSPDEVATERDRAGAREGPFAAVELRFLSKVNSGHPGADFHLAAIAVRNWFHSALACVMATGGQRSLKRSVRLARWPG
jgi:hypothetical protein